MSSVFVVVGSKPCYGIRLNIPLTIGICSTNVKFCSVEKSRTFLLTTACGQNPIPSNEKEAPLKVKYDVIKTIQPKSE